MKSHSKSRFVTVVSVIFSFGVGVPKGAACPGTLFLEELNPRIEGPRHGMRLFSKQFGNFYQIPMQQDPVDADGRLMFFDSQVWRTDPNDEKDMLTFKISDFGEKISYKKDRLPCRGPVTYQLRDKFSKKYAYLTNCGPNQRPSISPLFPVSFDQKNHTIKAKNYEYVFNSENYMQFKNIGFTDPKGVVKLVAQDSELLIHADIKKFWSMDFDSDEIVSNLEASRLGPIGDLARVSFYLKLLMFEIDLQLHTNVGFYEDSGHIPMMVSIPVDARAWLHPGSGILYSWKPAPSSQSAEKKIKMPALQPDLAHKGAKELSSLGLKYCKNSKCYFEHATYFEGRRLSLDFGIEERLVKQGFFPMFVDDIGKYKEKMGWDIELKEKEKRIGVYFEVSGLPKGGHPWDFWLSLGDRRDTESTCPHPVKYYKIPSGTLNGKVSSLKAGK